MMEINGSNTPMSLTTGLSSANMPKDPLNDGPDDTGFIIPLDKKEIDLKCSYCLPDTEEDFYEISTGLPDSESHKLYKRILGDTNMTQYIRIIYRSQRGGGHL